MDQLCVTEGTPDSQAAALGAFQATPSLKDQGYAPGDNGKGYFVDSLGNVSTLYVVPATSYNEYEVDSQDDPQLPAIPLSFAGSPHNTSAGPYPKSGCWFDDRFGDASIVIQEQYLNCLKDPKVAAGEKDPSLCN